MPGNDQRAKHNIEMSINRRLGPVKHRPCCQVVFGQPKEYFDLEQGMIMRGDFGIR